MHGSEHPAGRLIAILLLRGTVTVWIDRVSDGMQSSSYHVKKNYTSISMVRVLLPDSRLFPGRVSPHSLFVPIYAHAVQLLNSC